MISGIYELKGSPAGYEQVTVSDSVIGLDPPANATKAILGVEDNALRYRDDGEDPTASEGFLLKTQGNNRAPHVVLNSKEAIDGFNAIRDGAEDATLNVLYYKSK